MRTKLWATVGACAALGLAGCNYDTTSADSSGGGGKCDTNYEGACLDPNAADYDCESGSGNGPLYIGTVQVVGADVYDLDRDGDGTGCD